MEKFLFANLCSSCSAVSFRPLFNWSLAFRLATIPRSKAISASFSSSFKAKALASAFILALVPSISGSSAITVSAEVAALYWFNFLVASSSSIDTNSSDLAVLVIFESAPPSAKVSVKLSKRAVKSSTKMPVSINPPDISDKRFAACAELNSFIPFVRLSVLSTAASALVAYIYKPPAAIKAKPSGPPASAIAAFNPRIDKAAVLATIPVLAMARPCVVVAAVAIPDAPALAVVAAVKAASDNVRPLVAAVNSRRAASKRFTLA